MNEKFSMKPFQFKMDEETLKSIFKFSPKKKSELIKKGQGMVGDSLITLSFEKNSFFFLKKKRLNTFYGAEIVDSHIKLSNGICIGMSKVDFLKSFNKTNLKSDTIIITDTNEICYHYFFFEKSKLVMIKIDGCLD